MDSSKAAAVVVCPLAACPGAKVRSQLGPKGAIHGIGAMPSGLSGISAHVTVIIGLRIIQQKELLSF